MASLSGNIKPPGGFDALYGLEVIDYSDEHISGRVTVRPEICQPYGLVHGGVYASIAESLASMATALAVAADGDVALGLSNSTSFMRPITEGHINASATRLHRGRSTWVWDVACRDDDSRLCALTRMTIAVKPRKTNAS